MIQFDLIRAHDPELCGYMEFIDIPSDIITQKL